jgi:hypothetical protein
VLNKRRGMPFDAADEHRFAEFATSLGVVLESWWQMARTRSAREGPGTIPPSAELPAS